MFKERLQQVRERVRGAKALALVAKDGIPVESVAASDFDMELLAAELMAQVRTIANNHEELDVGTVRQLTVATDRMTLMISAITEEYFFLLVLDNQANQGRARFELRRGNLLFEKDLI